MRRQRAATTAHAGQSARTTTHRRLMQGTRSRSGRVPFARSGLQKPSSRCAHSPSDNRTLANQERPTSRSQGRTQWLSAVRDMDLRAFRAFGRAAAGHRGNHEAGPDRAMPSLSCESAAGTQQVLLRGCAGSGGVDGFDRRNRWRRRFGNRLACLEQATRVANAVGDEQRMGWQAARSRKQPDEAKLADAGGARVGRDQR